MQARNHKRGSMRVQAAVALGLAFVLIGRAALQRLRVAHDEAL